MPDNAQHDENLGFNPALHTQQSEKITKRTMVS